MSIKVVKQNYSERLANILASRDKCELSGGCKEILGDEKAEALLDKLPKTLELEDSGGPISILLPQHKTRRQKELVYYVLL